jgi:hypothetical protein
LRDIAALVQAFTPIIILTIGVVSAGIIGSNPNIDKSVPGLIATGSIAMAGTAYQAQK